MNEPIPIHLFGKDHWSTFAYLETRIVDHNGIINNQHMRCNNSLHPQFSHIKTSKEYPTRLKHGAVIHDHDDWSCLDDCEAAGLIENIGIGVNRQYKLTPVGHMVAGKLRAHLAVKNPFNDFEVQL